MEPLVSGPALGLDTSGDPVSACLALPDGGCEIVEALAGQRAGDVLHEMIAGLLRRAGLMPSDLVLVAAVRGPGSFTGLRVGLATASGLALGTGARSAGIETTRAMACEAGGESDLLALIDGGQGRLFAGWQTFDGSWPSPLEGPLDLEPAEVLARHAARPMRALLRGTPACLPELLAAGVTLQSVPLARAAVRLGLRDAAAEGLLLPARPDEFEAFYAREPAIRPSVPPPRPRSTG